MATSDEFLVIEGDGKVAGRATIERCYADLIHALAAEAQSRKTVSSRARPCQALLPETTAGTHRAPASMRAGSRLLRP